MDALFEHGLPGFGIWSVDDAPSEGGVFGAVLFWGYIVAALYLVFDLTRTILALRKISGILKYGYSPFYVWTFAALGALSFASTSWNLLNVLARSYQDWAVRTGTVSPERIFGNASLLGPQRIELHLWDWSVQSNLFYDFVLEITTDSTRWTWAQASLGFTCVVAYLMGIQGRKGKPLPKLWTFFALLQILPSSVTLNFYILALLFTPPTAPKQFVLQSPAIWIATGLGYFFLMVEVSTERMRPYLIPLVIFARLLLFAPFVLGLTWVDPQDPILEKVSPLQMFDLPLAFSGLALWSVLHSAYWASDEHGLENVWEARSVHPAVSSLAYDAIQSTITIVAWGMSAAYARPQAPPPPSVVEEKIKAIGSKKKAGNR